jgi:hypothetical protein
MLASNQDEHEGVALESAEFWMAFLDSGKCRGWPAG